MIDTIVRVAENTVDEVTNAEGREVTLEEDYVLMLPFLLPEDGYRYIHKIKSDTKKFHSYGSIIYLVYTYCWCILGHKNF